DALRAEQRVRRERGDARRLGIGLSVYVEITNGFASPEWGEVEVTAEGRAVVRSGLSPHGQGHGTALAMLASERLGLPLEAIEVVHGDTDAVPRGGGPAVVAGDEGLFRRDFQVTEVVVACGSAGGAR